MDEDLLWHIPITYASKMNVSNGSDKPRFWLHERQQEITLNELSSTSYFIVNYQQVGYYRVQYDETNWMLIANELSAGNFSELIPPNSRAMILDDASVFFEMGILKLKILLEIIKYLENDVSKIRFL